MIPDCGNLDLVNLIDGLLRKDPKKRFCFKDIRNHPFFHPLDFDDVMKQKYKPLNRPKPMTLKQTESDLSTGSDDCIIRDYSSIDDGLIYIPDFYLDRLCDEEVK